MSKNLVSIVIPVYNAEKSITDVLSHVIKQTYTPFEIILVNDGSTDNSAKIIQDFIDRNAFNKNITYKYYYQVNAGPSKARNHGISCSSGEFIAFLDSDDFWAPDKMEKQMALFQKEPCLDIIFSDSEIVRHKGKTITKFKLFDKLNISKNTFGHEYLIVNPTEELIKHNFLTTPSLIARRKCFSSEFLFNENRKHMEDWELWLKLSLFYQFGYINEALVLVIDEGDGLHSDNFDMIISQIEVVERFLENYEKQIKEKVSYQMLSKIIFTHFKWGGYYLMNQGYYKKSRDLYKKAWKEKFDLMLILYYLKSFAMQNNLLQPTNRP